jgi:FMN phosphatase YigB (HAD superfamily)
MIKNITFSAEDTLIEEAHEVARADNTTLNEQFRLWLEDYARKRRVQKFQELMGQVKGKYSSGGHKFTRDEMNERR